MTKIPPTVSVYKGLVCPAQIAVAQPEDGIYPLVVSCTCHVCDKKHPFAFSSKMTVGTPNMLTRLEMYLRLHDIPLIPLKSE